MAHALWLALLLAPVATKSWSKAHGVGYRLPPSWKVHSVDKAAEVFSAQGPRAGGGFPNAKLQVAGALNTTTLAGLADKLAARVLERTGWSVATRTLKRVGPFPAIRLGIRFQDGDAKGRARATVVALDHQFVVLEMSAPAARFPGGMFDRLERSLAVKWHDHKEAALRARAPASWRRLERAGIALEGPTLGRQAWVVHIEASTGPLEGPPGAKLGPSVRWLGKARDSLVAERESGGEKARLLVTQADGVRAIVVMPQAAWKHYFPVSAAILASVKRKADTPGKKPDK